MKLPVPCAPAEENVIAAGGGASGARSGAEGKSGTGPLPAPAGARAVLGLRDFDSLRVTSCVARPCASSVVVTPDGGSSRTLPRADAAAAPHGRVSGGLQLAFGPQASRAF